MSAPAIGPPTTPVLMIAGREGLPALPPAPPITVSPPPPQATVAGVVVATPANAPPVIATELGQIQLNLRANLPAGARVVLEIGEQLAPLDGAPAPSVPSAALPLSATATAWPSLDEAVALLRAREAAGGTLWFQLYMSKERESAARLVNRARDAGYEALIVTTDVPMIGNREPNLRNGWQIPFKLGVKNMIDGVLHPHWLVNTFFRTLLDSGVPRFQNTDVNVGGRIITTDLSQFRSRRDALDWSDFQWLREIWPHKFFIKGVLHPEDARMAVQYGADGVFVSNHGGQIGRAHV